MEANSRPGHYDLVGDKEELKHYLVGYVCDAWDEDEGDQGAGET
jgi:hypothetical protein